MADAVPRIALYFNRRELYSCIGAHVITKQKARGVGEFYVYETSMKTMGSQLDAQKGIGQGFDFLRVVLALLVILNHSFFIVEGNYETIEKNRLTPFFWMVLPMFFALSGFLIAGSAQRLRLKDFLLNRSMRIMPALAVDIVLSALVIGPIFTTLSFHDYFHNREFAAYFFNIVGLISYTLPGIFMSNPVPAVANGSLWTVPFEVGCYALMSSLIVFGAIKSHRRMVLAALFFTVLYYLFYICFQNYSPASDGQTGFYINNFFSSRGNYLYFDFLGGVLLYTFRHKIPLSGLLALAGILLVLLNGWDLIPLGAAKPLVLGLPVAYLAVYIGLQRVKNLPPYIWGDYSYGIYLYAYPLQQVLVDLFPGKFSPVFHFLCSAICATGVAMLSWHLVEKPILKLRRKFSFTARKGDEVVSMPKHTKE